jgi:hypothetical protein
MNIYIDIFISIYNNISIFIYATVSNEKWKPRRFSSICLPFAHHENESLLFVRLFTKKHTEVICLQTDYTDLPIYDCALHSYGTLPARFAIIQLFVPSLLS